MFGTKRPQVKNLITVVFSTIEIVSHSTKATQSLKGDVMSPQEERGSDKDKGIDTDEWEDTDEREEALKDHQAEVIRTAIKEKTQRSRTALVFGLVDDLSQVVIEGQCIFTYPYLDIDRWAPGLYSSQVVENPTFLDLAVIADEAIQSSQDHHHCFFEGFSEVGVSPEGIPLYELEFGS
jgi:hypothetical protein